MTAAPSSIPACCNACCSQDMPVPQVGHQPAPKKKALKLRLEENSKTSAAPDTSSSVMLRVVDASAATGTIKHAKTNSSLEITGSNADPTGSFIASACARFRPNIGRQIVNARKVSFASSS